MITTIQKVMTKKVISTAIGTSLFEANQIMQEKRIRHLPITDQNDVVIGVLSQRDLQYVPNSKNILVEMMMKTPVEFVMNTTTLRDSVFIMLQKKISCLLITDESEDVVGIVTTDDLLWYLSHLLADEKDGNFSLLSLKTKESIGAIANELSAMGF